MELSQRQMSFSPSSLVRITLICTFVACICPSSDVDAFVRRPVDRGLMKLCPPGGESFAAAWEITCGMRRKKRSVEMEGERENTTPKTSGQQKGKNVTTTLRSTQRTPVSEPLKMPSQRNWWVFVGEVLFGRDAVPRMWKSPTADQTAESKMAQQVEEEKYRAPSMTEMMLFCCRFGCSLRDLMPYCDPFGEWDS